MAGAETGSPGRAGQVRWRRRLFLGGVAAVAGLVSLHAFGGRVTGMGAIVIGGLALLGFVIIRLPHLRRHFARPGAGGRGPGSLNFPSQVAARERRKRMGLFRRRGGPAGSGGPGGGAGGGFRGPRMPRLFRGRRRSGAGSGGSWGTAGSSSRRRSGLFRGGRRRGSGTGAAFGSAGSSSRRRSGLFRGRHGSGSSFRGGSRRAGGTGARRGHLPVWRRHRPAAAGGGTRTRRGFVPWRRRSRPAGGTRRRGAGGGLSPRGRIQAQYRRNRAAAAGTGGRRHRPAAAGRPPGFRHPLARARWRRTGGRPAAPGRPRRRILHRIIGTPAQRHTRHLARIARRARVRAARRRTRVNPYARTSRWRARRHHRRWWRRQHPHTGQRLGWRNRLARRWRIRRGLHRGLGFSRRRLSRSRWWRDRRWRRNRRPPRPLLAGLRNSPGLRRFAQSPLGRLATWADRRRADRWLRRQRRHAPAGVVRPRVSQPATASDADWLRWVRSIPEQSRGGHRVDTHAMADEIRTMGQAEFADPQDVHDTLTGMHEMVQAMQDVLNGWGLSLAETGVHPRYPEAAQEAAQRIAGVAETLEEVTSGGVMRGPGG